MKLSYRIPAILILAALGSVCLAAGQGGLSADISKGDLLFLDDFSTSKVGGSWGCSSDDNYSFSYQDGIYIIEVIPADSWRRVQSGRSFGDSVVEVEATPIEGPDDNVYGLMTGWLNWSNYYLFMISGDGYFKFIKREEGQWARNDPWTRSEAINHGKATNLVQVKREGETLSFFANGIKLADYEDEAFPEGNVGVMAGTTSCGGGNLTVGFDNFSVWTIEEA